MQLYSYDGPVRVFDDLVASHWKAETRAPSERKARSNLAYQYKQTHNLASQANIKITGKLTLERGN